MPDLQTIRAGIAELTKSGPLVVALTGATTGIGSYVARALATTFAHHGSNLRVYIVGRNASRAEELLANGCTTSPGSEWIFITVGNLALMKDVDRVSAEIIRREEEAPFAGGPPRLDVLYMSQALSPIQESNVTAEGLDSQMSLLYYSRMRLIQNFIPLLKSSTQATGAHVISIFSGSMEGSVTPGELPIGTPEPKSYGVTAVRNHTVFMKTFMFEELAEQHAGKISFVHIYPGLVDGPVLNSNVNPWWFRVLWRPMKLLLSWYMTSSEDCGQVMLYLATAQYPAKNRAGSGGGRGSVAEVAYSTQQELGGGSYGVGQRGDALKVVSYKNVRDGDTTKKVWYHTMGVLSEIEEKNAGNLT